MNEWLLYSSVFCSDRRHIIYLSTKDFSHTIGGMEVDPVFGDWSDVYSIGLQREALVTFLGCFKSSAPRISLPLRGSDIIVVEVAGLAADLQLVEAHSSGNAPFRIRSWLISLLSLLLLL